MAKTPNLKGHVSAHTLNVIFMDYTDFNHVLSEALGDAFSGLEYDLNGLTVNVDDDIDVNQKLAEYFEVDEVTSFHADDYDELGIWIAYR